MYTVYLDESGTTQGQEAVTVAGCVSSNKKWKRLETEWRAILSEYGVSVFHMADCAGKRREYSAANGWDSQRRKAFLSELAECAAKHVQYAASITIPVRDFAEAAREINLKPGDRSEFLAAGRTTIHILCNWIKKKGANPDQAGYFFEKGVTAGIGNLQTLVKMRQGIALEQTPKSNPGAQVADMIAWKTRRIVHDAISKPNTMTLEDIIKSLKPITSIRGRYEVVDTDRLAEQYLYS